MQNLTCTAQANLDLRRRRLLGGVGVVWEFGGSGGCRQRSALGHRGRWGSDNPACKTTAAKFAKCLEFKQRLESSGSCSARTKSNGGVRVDVQSPAATSASGATVNKLLFFCNAPSSYSSRRHPRFSTKSRSFVKTKLKFAIYHNTMQTHLS